MDVLDHLMKEHREAEAMLAALGESSPGAERAATLAKLGDALTLHMEVEERDVYPLILQHLEETAISEA